LIKNKNGSVENRLWRREKYYGEFFDKEEILELYFRDIKREVAQEAEKS
jgi:hypothetical protein